MGPTDIIPAGATLRVTATGRGNYTGEISRTYSVAAYDIAMATVNVANQTYSGVPVMPDKSDITSISMKIGKNVVPLEAYEYEIVPGSYKKNTAAGTGTMQIHGRGQYCGYKTVNFKIAARSMYYNISFFANGGTGTMKTQNISKSGTELTKNAYKRTGYDFLGWNTKEDGTGITYADKDRIGIVVAGGNLSLHAMWREKE